VAILPSAPSRSNEPQNHELNSWRNDPEEEPKAQFLSLKMFLRRMTWTINPNSNDGLRFFFASTFEALKNGEIGIPKDKTGHEVSVEFTEYSLVLDIETDIAKVKFVDITEKK
jgi:hypothetical protein